MSTLLRETRFSFGAAPREVTSRDDFAPPAWMRPDDPLRSTYARLAGSARERRRHLGARRSGARGPLPAWPGGRPRAGRPMERASRARRRFSRPGSGARPPRRPRSKGRSSPTRRCSASPPRSRPRASAMVRSTFPPRSHARLHAPDGDRRRSSGLPSVALSRLVVRPSPRERGARRGCALPLPLLDGRSQRGLVRARGGRALKAHSRGRPSLSGATFRPPRHALRRKALSPPVRSGRAHRPGHDRLLLESLHVLRHVPGEDVPRSRPRRDARGSRRRRARGRTTGREALRRRRRRARPSDGPLARDPRAGACPLFRICVACRVTRWRGTSRARATRSWASSVKPELNTLYIGPGIGRRRHAEEDRERGRCRGARPRGVAERAEPEWRSA